MDRNRRISLLCLPLLLAGCDLMKKTDSAGGSPSASASSASAAPGTSATSQDTNQPPLPVAPSAAPNRGGVAPVRTPDGGASSPEGGAWVIPTIPSNLPPLPSHLVIPSGLPPIPSNLPIPRPPGTH